MTNLDPKEYKNGQRVGAADAMLHVGETVSSSSEKVTLGPAKAVAALIATPLVAFLTALGVAVQPIYDAAGVLVEGSTNVSGAEWITIAIATVVSTGLVGTATFATPTSVTRER